MIYLGWFDDNAKKPVPTRIAEAVERYIQRFGQQPNVVLVSDREGVEIAGLKVRPTHHIRPNNYQIGRELCIGN